MTPQEINNRYARQALTLAQTKAAGHLYFDDKDLAIKALNRGINNATQWLNGTHPKAT